MCRHMELLGHEEEGKTGVWGMKHQVKCVVKEILLPRMTVVIYSVFPFPFQTHSPAWFSICGRCPAAFRQIKKSPRGWALPDQFIPFLLFGVRGLAQRKTHC